MPSSLPVMLVENSSSANPQSPAHVRVRTRRNALQPNSRELEQLRAFAEVYRERRGVGGSVRLDEEMREEVERRLEMKAGADGGVTESDCPESED